MNKKNIENVDFLITTMDRYYLLKELLDSIFMFYPQAKVTIADQSNNKEKDFYKQYSEFDVNVKLLQYDCGLSYARNLLVDITERDYILILEDDFLFNKYTRIEWMLILMDRADIVGGAVIRNGKRLKFEHYFEKKNHIITQVDDGDIYLRHESGLQYKNTGCVLNFALFNRCVFDLVKWDARLKLREHQHFFYRVKNRIVFTPDVWIIDNRKTAHPEYKRLKGRDQFWKIALEDLGVKKFKYLNGQCVEIEGDAIARYKEL